MDPANVDGDHAAHRPVSQALDPDICGSSCDQNRSPALLRSLTIPVSSSRVSKLYSSALSLDICLLRLLLGVIILAEVCLRGHAPANKHLSAQTGDFHFGTFGEYSSGTDNDPGLNRTYAEMGEHYGTAILPARPYKPKDKAKVEEVAVQVSQRWIVARLRNRRFFSLAELNAAIRPLLDDLNARVMWDYNASRADLFAALDRPNLAPLPASPYVFARWKRARVAPDYHIEANGCWYSVPFGLIRQLVDLRITQTTVEIFHRGKRVASHVRNPGRRGHVTLADHMPSSHRRYAEWTPARILASAEKLGPSVAAFCQIVMETSASGTRVPDLSRRSVIGKKL